MGGNAHVGIHGPTPYTRARGSILAFLARLIDIGEVMGEDNGRFGFVGQLPELSLFTSGSGGRC
jgi:hypothetical protein